MDATYDETVELSGGETGVVVAISAQLEYPFARRYFVRLNGSDYHGAEVEVHPSAIVRLVYAAPPHVSLAPAGERERTLTEYRDAIETEGPNASYYVPRG